VLTTGEGRSSGGSKFRAAGQQRRQYITQMLFDVGSEHAEDDMGPYMPTIQWRIVRISMSAVFGLQKARSICARCLLSERIFGIKLPG
jgi:hypothetical protein